MSTSEGSKKRKPNFTNEEVEAITKGYADHKGIIEGKFSAGITNCKKTLAWKLICDKVNGVGGHGRNWLEVKTKYKNLYSDTKKILANNKVEIKKTGGGPANLTQLSEIQIQISSNIPKIAIEGISGGIDIAGESSGDDCNDKNESAGSSALSLSSPKLDLQVKKPRFEPEKIDSLPLVSVNEDRSEFHANYFEETPDEFSMDVAIPPIVGGEIVEGHICELKIDTIMPVATTSAMHTPPPAKTVEKNVQRREILNHLAKSPFSKKLSEKEVKPTYMSLQDQQVKLLQTQVDILGDIRDLIRERNGIEKEKLEREKEREKNGYGQ